MDSLSPSVYVVIPTIRSLDFLDDWREQFRDATLIICEDHTKKEIPTPKNIGQKVYHYSWKEIDQDLKKNSWIIPRKVSAIRSYGFLKAYQMGAEIIITIDDDCYPVSGHVLIEDHVRNLHLRAPARWTNTYPDSRFLYTRGMPYLNRQDQPVKLSHGLWTSVLDFDAPTHLQHLSFNAEFAQHFLQFIPHGAYFPMCSMNMAFHRDLAPLMYFPLMGEDSTGKKWGFDRFDDIWAGIFTKKIMDYLGWSAVNGAPFVEHRKASDPFINLQKEAAGIQKNEEVWQKIDQFQFTHSLSTKPALGTHLMSARDANAAATLYAELASCLDTLKPYKYFTALVQAMRCWASLF